MRRTAFAVLAVVDQGDVGEDVAAQGELALGEAVEEGVGGRRGAGARRGTGRGGGARRKR